MSVSNKETMIIIGKLIVVAVVAALLLGITYVPTSAQIKLNEELAKQEVLRDIFPQDDITFEAVEGDAVDEEGEREILYYRVKDETGNIVGYAFFQRQPGYEGTMLVAGGVDSTFSNVKGMDVVSHQETPGLGSLITEPRFRDQFFGLPVNSLDLKADGGDVDAITGATVSSRAVVDALNVKINEIKQKEGQ